MGAWLEKFRVEGDKNPEAERRAFWELFSEREEVEWHNWGAPDLPSRIPAQFILDHLWAESDGLPEYLARICVDPGIVVGTDEEGGGVWYFSNLVGALCELQERHSRKAAEKVARTEVSAMVTEVLDFCLARRRWVLAEGLSGVGKSHVIKTWCAMHAGAARFVEVPSSNDDRSFYANIAAALGVASGLSFNTQQIKLRVEETLKESGLMLVFDECHFLIPQYARPRGIPSRLQWLKSTFDSGTPLAIIGLPDFSKWQALYVKTTMWSDEQLERRINRKIRLPAVQSKEDFVKIAQTHFPEGTANSWLLLAGYALASVKKQASAITEALESPRFRAERDGRELVTFDDIEAVIREIHLPSEHDYRPSPAVPADAPQPFQTRPARTVQTACTTRSGAGENVDSAPSLGDGRDEMPEALAARATGAGLFI
jgi:hypothetical protein